MIVTRLAGVATAAALLATAAAPAEAQRWGGYRHRHGGGDTVGNLLLGGLIGGVVVAAATAGSRRKTVEHVADAGPLPAPPIAPPGEYDRAGPGPALSDIGSQGEAVDVCTAAAEDGARARVDHVSHVVREGDVWRVDGVVDDARRRRDGGDFTCSAARGRVVEFRYRAGGVAGGPAF